MHAGLNNHGNRLWKKLNGMCLIKDLPQLSSISILLSWLMMELCHYSKAGASWHNRKRIATYSLYGLLWPLIFLNLSFPLLKIRIGMPISERWWLEPMRQLICRKAPCKHWGKSSVCREMHQAWCWANLTSPGLASYYVLSLLKVTRHS